MKEKKEIILKILNNIFEIIEKKDIDKFSKIEVQIYGVNLLKELHELISEAIEDEDYDRVEESKELPNGLHPELERILKGLV